ncbi:MAG: hypothetical protein HY749_02730 [Gammaproteobacteria bacterium]|nr:hypothetical protein [Gammaproteobacteria bacterium]MBI5616501.1 hypothetical protein [Gammaproteobacteria bacterium]
MTTHFHHKLVATALCTALLGGCATQGQSTSTNTAAGTAAVGALIGGLTGGWEGAAIGALSGAAVGWVAGKVIESQEVAARSQTQDQQLYGYAAPANSVFVKINSATSNPKFIAPGGTVDVVTDYSLALPKSSPQAQIGVTGVLFKDGVQLMDFKNQPVTKTAGGYTIKLPIKIPGDAAPGTYVIKHTVTSGTSYDTAESTFVVKTGA